MARKMRRTKSLASVVGLLVLAMVPLTMQMSVERENEDEGSALGIILPNSNSDINTFFKSGYYQPNLSKPFIVIAGRKFYIGKFAGRNAVCVNAGKPLANVGVTVQLLDKFDISGLIVFGKSGGTSNRVDVPNVVVPTHVSYTGVWSWQEEEDSLEATDELPTLKVGDYNLPEPGKNKLGSIQFKRVTKFTPKHSKNETFWFYVDPDWLNIANEIQPSEIDQCFSNEKCSDDLPEIVHGLRVASSDILVSNEAYANFLWNKLEVAAVDTASAAVASAAVANKKPFVIIRGISNKPGTPYNAQLSAQAGRNVLKVVKAFVDRLPQKKEKAHFSMY